VSQLQERTSAPVGDLRDGTLPASLTSATRARAPAFSSGGGFL